MQASNKSIYQNSTVKAVLFDLDDTLFDFQYCHRCGLDAAREVHPVLSQITTDDVVREYSALIEDVWPRVLRGEITVEQSRIERFRRVFVKVGHQATDEETLALERRYWEVYQAQRRQVPGAAALLSALKPYVTVGIVTNNLQLIQEEKLQYCGLDHLIDFMVVSEKVGSIKPDPVIFNVALQMAGCKAEEAVMVGDSWTADILGARAVGMRAVWLNRNGSTCPDSTLATEINELTPVDKSLPLLLNNSGNGTEKC